MGIIKLLYVLAHGHIKLTPSPVSHPLNAQTKNTDFFPFPLLLKGITQLALSNMFCSKGRRVQNKTVKLEIMRKKTQKN